MNHIILFPLKSYNLNLIPERGTLKKEKTPDSTTQKRSYIWHLIKTVVHLHPILL